MKQCFPVKTIAALFLITGAVTFSACGSVDEDMLYIKALSEHIDWSALSSGETHYVLDSDTDPAGVFIHMRAFDRDNREIFTDYDYFIHQNGQFYAVNEYAARISPHLPRYENSTDDEGLAAPGS